MMCGKIGAGKSTFCAQLAQVGNTVVISEDRWIEQLYPPEEMKSLSDYFQRSERLRKTITPHVIDLLRTGVSIALDFRANTVASRRWMRGLFEEGRALHQLHFLDVPEEVCRARMHARRAQGGDGLTNAEFDYVTRFFAPPDPSEGFNVARHTL
jgi:predicted kinase